MVSMKQLACAGRRRTHERVPLRARMDSSGAFVAAVVILVAASVDAQSTAPPDPSAR